LSTGAWPGPAHARNGRRAREALDDVPFDAARLSVDQLRAQLERLGSATARHEEELCEARQELASQREELARTAEHAGGLVAELRSQVKRQLGQLALRVELRRSAAAEAPSPSAATSPSAGAAAPAEPSPTAGRGAEQRQRQASPAAAAGEAPAATPPAGGQPRGEAPSPTARAAAPPWASPSATPLAPREDAPAAGGQPRGEAPSPKGAATARGADAKADKMQRSEGHEEGRDAPPKAQPGMAKPSSDDQERLLDEATAVVKGATTANRVDKRRHTWFSCLTQAANPRVQHQRNAKVKCVRKSSTLRQMLRLMDTRPPMLLRIWDLSPRSSGRPDVKEPYASESEQTFYMKRAIESDNVREALKHASNMICELRTSLLSPKNYYELYMQVFREMQNLSDFFGDSSRHKKKMVDLYESVQSAGNILPRLYLLATVAKSYVQSKEAPAKEILTDVNELSKGIQHPLRGLFLRYYISQMLKDKVPDTGSEFEGEGGNIDDAFNFIFSNFMESNRLWVRIQHQGPAKDKAASRWQLVETGMGVGGAGGAGGAGGRMHGGGRRGGRKKPGGGLGGVGRR
ncbi:unnamed protein product, partial [Prorocentrum cordatum]